MSQCEQILDALKRGPLTPIEALSAYGVMRLASRVLELRERGYPIATEKLRAGGKSYARYRLLGK
jgi:hypothetical protein